MFTKMSSSQTGAMRFDHFQAKYMLLGRFHVQSVVGAYLLNCMVFTVAGLFGLCYFGAALTFDTSDLKVIGFVSPSIIPSLIINVIAIFALLCRFRGLSIAISVLLAIRCVVFAGYTLYYLLQDEAVELALLMNSVFSRPFIRPEEVADLVAKPILLFLFVGSVHVFYLLVWMIYVLNRFFSGYLHDLHEFEKNCVEDDTD